MTNSAAMNGPSAFPEDKPHGLSWPATPPTHETRLRLRITELETLCAEVYVAAATLGLPQDLLNRLWAAAAEGSAPGTAHNEAAPRAASGFQTLRGVFTRHPNAASLADRQRCPDVAPRAGQPELQTLPRQYTVLVVDDDPMMLEVLVRILRRENYVLLTARNGRDALRVAEQHDGKIDLLITDFVMPGMQGRELADKMHERDRAIKVLYQTGFGDMLFENRDQLEVGAAFLEKPFTARGLREATRLMLLGAINPPA